MSSNTPGQPLVWSLATLLALLLLLFKVGVSDVRALRASPVGPTVQVSELRELRPLLHDEPTLFLGDDDFIEWELVGVPVGTPVFGGEESMIRPEKDWSRGMALDFDTVEAATLNSYQWVVTTRDAAGSEAPPQMRLEETTPNFALFRRVGEVQARSILPEGGMAGAVLDCQSPEGRAVLRGGGVAAVRPLPMAVAGGLLQPGGTATVELALGPGRWVLESSYVSRLAIEAAGPGLRTTLPPNLDRPGPRWPVGTIAIEKEKPTVLTFHVEDPLIAPNLPTTDLGTIVATRIAPERIVPVREACGRYVDWYRPAPAG